MLKRLWHALRSYILNGLAHYTLADRLEYTYLLIRPKCAIPYVSKEPLHTPLSLCNEVKVVSLSDRLDRRAFIASQFIAQKIKFSYWEAIRVDRKECGKLYSRFFHERSIRYLSAGSLGCWVSHCLLWEHMFREQVTHQFIYEDDVMLEACYCERTAKLLQMLPADFDIVILNSANRYGRNIRAFVGPHIFLPYQLRNGLFAYVISASGARKILSHLPRIPITRGGIDSAVGALIRHRRLNAYHLRHAMISVNFGLGSDIR